jgi:hypothetical protein
MARRAVVAVASGRDNEPAVKSASAPSPAGSYLAAEYASYAAHALAAILPNKSAFPVNLASRMEGLTKIYGTSLIISNRTQSLLKDPSRFSFRTLDRVQVKGKKEPVIVIEVLDGETDSVRQLKEASRAKFDEAQKLYLSQKFENARSLFIEVLKNNPDDRAAGIFVRRCRLYMEKGVPEGWNGVEQMTTK